MPTAAAVIDAVQGGQMAILQRLFGATADPVASSLTPDSPDTAERGVLSSASLRRGILFFVLVGVFARVMRYALRFPLWDDESFLCVNFISRSYVELLRPLDYHQVAPILFLWIERTAARLFGFCELVLRLFPFVCSIASLLLFRKTASRLLSSLGLLVAVAIFSVSYPGIRYAAEAKPYGSDLFVSLGLLFLTVEWLERRESRWLWWLACLTPLAIGLSYPAVFAAGGFSLVVAACLWKHGGTRSEWRAWTVWNAALVAGFGFCFWLSGRVQAGAESEFMTRFWSVHFPPARQPWKLPFWLVQTHASDFLAYPVGGPNWASSLTFIFVLVGIWRLCQRRNGVLLGLFLAPCGLHFLAALLQKYPYGGHVKFSQYLAPAICCLAAVGVVESCAFWSRRGLPVRRSLACAAVLLGVVGLGVVVRDVALPYKTQSDYRERAFAQGFWFPAERDAEVACLKSDFGLDFVPDQFKDLSWSAQYLCNQAIEKSRYHLKRPDLSRVSHTRPLCCVLYRESRFKFDEERFANWLAEMQERYELVGRDSVSLPRMRQDERTVMAVEYVDTYKFVPRDASKSATIQQASGQSVVVGKGPSSGDRQ
jgi:hypothetical protein